MKHLVLIFILLFTIIQESLAQNKTLDDLLSKKRFTTAQKVLDTITIDEQQKQVYQSVLYNVFGKAEQLSRIIDRTINKQTDFPDSIKYILWKTQHDNYVKLFDYPKAISSLQYMLEHYRMYITPENMQGIDQTMRIWKALKNEQPQKVIQPLQTILPLNKGIGGMRVPLTRNNVTYSFIFDTGAGISTVTDSMAEVLGLRMLDSDTILVKGITGFSNNVGLAIADKLWLGDIEVQNAFFLVFPDSSLTFGSGKRRVKIDAILGFPVIKELGAITFYKDKLMIKQDDSTKYEPNMAIDFLKQILFLNYEGEELPFTFDTGADRTLFSALFYSKYKSIADKGRRKYESYGGAGGIRKYEVKVLPTLTFSTLGESVKFRKARISTDTYAIDNEMYYGNIGQDLIKQYSSMTINFRQSYIRFNK
jgi:predicted aspartyl protease